MSIRKVIMIFRGSPYEMQTEMSRGPLAEDEAQHPPTQPKRKKGGCAVLRLTERIKQRLTKICQNHFKNYQALALALALEKL